MKIPTISINPNPKPRHYYRGWLIWLSIFIGLRLIIRDRSDNTILLLMTGYAFPLWLFSGIMSMIDKMRFYNYLRTNHSKAWDSLSPLGDFVGLKRLSFVTSKEDWGDPIISEWKNNLFRLWRFLIVVFLTFPVMFAVFLMLR